MNTARKESSGPTHKRAEDVPRCGALSLLQKPLHYKGGLSRNRAQLLCMWPLVVRCMYMAVVPRPMPAAITARYRRRRYQQLTCACGTKSRRGALADARGATQVLVVMYRPLPAAPLVFCCMYLAVVHRCLRPYLRVAVGADFSSWLAPAVQ